MAAAGVQGLIGSWDYVDGENFDDFLKELGVGMMLRMTAKTLKPRLVFSEAGGQWTVQSQSKIKNTEYSFTPDQTFDEVTPDGRDVSSTITFEGDRWVHTSIDKNGKKSVVVRFIDNEGQQMIEMECNGVRARRWYKRV